MKQIYAAKEIKYQKKTKMYSRKKKIYIYILYVISLLESIIFPMNIFLFAYWLNLKFAIADSSPGTSDIVAKPSYSLDCSAPGVPGDRILSIESWLFK